MLRSRVVYHSNQSNDTEAAEVAPVSLRTYQSLTVPVGWSTWLNGVGAPFADGQRRSLLQQHCNAARAVDGCFRNSAPGGVGRVVVIAQADRDIVKESQFWGSYAGSRHSRWGPSRD